MSRPSHARWFWRRDHNARGSYAGSYSKESQQHIRIGYSLAPGRRLYSAAGMVGRTAMAVFRGKQIVAQSNSNRQNGRRILIGRRIRNGAEFFTFALAFASSTRPLLRGTYLLWRPTPTRDENAVCCRSRSQLCGLELKVSEPFSRSGVRNSGRSK